MREEFGRLVEQRDHEENVSLAGRKADGLSLRKP